MTHQFRQPHNSFQCCGLVLSQQASHHNSTTLWEPDPSRYDLWFTIGLLQRTLNGRLLLTGRTSNVHGRFSVCSMLNSTLASSDIQTRLFPCLVRSPRAEHWWFVVLGSGLTLSLRQTILHGQGGLNVAGADDVDISPISNTTSQTTALAAVAYPVKDMLTSYI